MKVANSPLFIEDVPENNNEIRRGSTAKRRLVVKNLGDKRAEIDIWIAAADNKSDPLLRWCTFSEKNPLSIDAKDSKEVTLNFQIPQQATLDLYNYEILVEAAAQYPGKIFRRPQQLRVLSSDQDAEFVNEPAFSIQPVTSSANPLPLQAGAQLQVKVRVENRSRRVDRFYLNCPELTKEWYTVRYPESSLDIPGLVKETDGLELNPGSTGEITLILHPPQYTPSRNYFPTIRLTSNNTEDLVLQDVVYLQILPDDRLNVEMRPLSRKIPPPAVFDLELSNQGNIKREITIRAKDEEGLFTYILQPSVVQISAGEKQKVALTVKPKQPWRRPWWGKGLTSTFNIELEDALLPNTSKPLALPNNLPQGTLVWQSRPWWLLWLLILLGLAAMGGVGFAIWLKFFNSQVPEVIKFEATQDREGKGDDISLHWEISKPSQVKKVTIIRQEGNVETDRKNFLFPDELKNRNGNCESSLPGMNSGDIQDVLKCTVLSQTPQKAGKYTFKIEVYSQQNQQQPASSQITDTITIKPIKPLPLPQITEFSSTQPAYKEVSATPSLGTNKAGEKTEKSVVIDTVDSTPPSQPQSSSPGGTSRQTAPTNNSAPTTPPRPSTANISAPTTSPKPLTANNSAPTTPPRPLNSSKLLPIELPPKPN